MKIENPSLSPLSSRPTESTKRTEKKEVSKNGQVIRAGHDKIEMSEDARLLAKARLALNTVDDEQDSEKLAALREKIESGDYTVQVTELARKLAAKFYPK